MTFLRLIMRQICFLLLLLSANMRGQETFEPFDIARSGSVEQAEKALLANPQIFNVVNHEGFSPLILACYKNNNKVAKIIIANGAPLDISGPMGTALMASVVKNNLEMAKLLLANKADPNNTDANNTTALIYAVQFKNLDMVALLVKYKADKSVKDNNGKTAFEYAVFSDNESIINLLKN